MEQLNLIVRSALLLVLLSVTTFSISALAQEQVITTNPASTTVGQNEAVSIEVMYSTANPADDTLTGLGLRLHFDSSQLALQDLSDVLATSLLVQGIAEADASDFDGDSTTDMFINVAWTDVDGGWPGAAEVVLYSANFTSSADFNGSTKVNFSSPSTAAGRTLEATSAVISLTGSDLPMVTITATDAEAAETGPDTGTFEVSRTGDTSAELSVSYSVAGTATAADDYTELSGSVTIAADAETATITVTPLEDSSEEGDETVELTLNADTAYLLGTPDNATVTISDTAAPLPPPPPPPASISITALDPTAAESGLNSGTFSIRNAGDSSAELNVTYSVNGTATADSDYAALSGSVILAVGTTTATITVAPLPDTIIEGSETVIVTLTENAAYGLGEPKAATVTILDDDRPPAPTITITATDIEADEIDLNPGLFTITRDSATEFELVVEYQVDGTAIAEQDYRPLSGSVTLPVGADSATIEVIPLEDMLVEDDETVIAILRTSSNYEISSPSRATIIISSNNSLFPTPVPIPTLSEWALLVLTLFMLVIGARAVGVFNSGRYAK